MPFKLTALQAIDLADDKRYQRYLTYLKDRVRCHTTDELLLVRRFFVEWYKAHPDFRSQFPDRAATIDALVIAGKWQAISGLQLDEIVDLCRNHLAALFTVSTVTADEDDQQQTVQEILATGLRTAIDGLANAVERDQFKQQIVQALEQNQEQITTAPFFLSVKAAPPTTANWLAQYQEYAGPKHNKFSISRFIKQHPN
ncbi:MAG: hypothetical protein HY565_02405, partial [Candidatus Kerfeldbacteria bacterium]|nr:hypothetical protein [Candidatus Kerfeldbacteria bacterium]